MLSDYIELYKEAIREGNGIEKARIERVLEQLGMDRVTLRILAGKGGKNGKTAVKRTQIQRH